MKTFPFILVHFPQTFRSDITRLVQSAAVVVLICQFQAAVSVSALDVTGVGEWSSWSTCSSSCGQGIASRSRDCGAESIGTQDSRICIGRNSQVKVCFLQACPTDRPSARELACSQYNSRVFSGKRYSWEPFIHPTDPCKLSCRARGVHFYANLPARLEDGESCSTGQIKAICVKGLCQDVGCDDMVASRAVKDKCGVCKGDDSSCKTISGIFTSTELKRGLNLIMSIPAGSTSINITELMASRNLLVLEDSFGKTFINGETKSPSSGDLMAAGTVFSYAARSPTNSKESIFASGPTNETIILKLLLRDVNPGIIYTFSVPNMLSDSVLRQIIHRRQPVEVAPESVYTLESQGGLDVESTLLAARLDGHGDRHRTHNTIPDDVAPYRTTTIHDGVATEGTTPTSGRESALNVSPTPARVREMTFGDISIGDTSNHKTLLGSSEENHQSGKNIDEIMDNGTRNLSFDSTESVRNTSANVHDMVESDKADDVSEMLEKPGLQRNVSAGDVHDKVKHHELTSQRPSSGNFEVNETTSVKTLLENFPSQDKQNSREKNVKSGEQVQSSDLDRPHLDTPDKDDSTTETLLAPKIVVVTRDDGQYHIPKYSQTFNYNSQQRTAENRHTDNSQDHDSSRSQHVRQDNGLNIQNPKIIQKSSPQRRSEFSRSQQLGSTHFGSLNSDRGDRISAFGTSLNQVGSTRREDPDKFHRERARIERQRQLQERQILMEQRRRRVEQQQRLYNERLREHNEKLQRRAQLVASRQRGNGGRTEPKVHNRSYQGFDRPEEQHRGNEASNRGSSMATHETAFNVAITDSGPVVTKVRDHRIETPREQDESIFRQQTGPEPTTITLKRGPIFAQPEGLTDDTQAENYDFHTNLTRKLNTNRNNGDNILPIDAGNSLDMKPEHRIDLNNFGATTSRLDSINKADRPDEETDIAKPHLLPSRENGASDINDGAFIRIRQRPKPAGPRYIPVASPESSALTGNDIPLDQSADTISNDLSSTNQIASEYRPPSNEVYPSNILPNQILLTSEQNTRNTAYEWRISGLTECTHSCGGGAQRTVVVCIDILSQAVVTDENCRHLIKPQVLTISCNKRPCPAVWTPGAWTPCTVTCGQGEQTRTVTCQARVSPTLNLTMPIESCENQERLSIRQPCANNPCSSWRVGNWTNCSAGCGDAQRSRDVDCVDTANNVMPDEMCTELKPSSEERCNLGECGKGWLFTDWPEECSAQCGTGQLTRHLFCGDDDGNPLPDNRCDINQRPADTKSCRTSRPCGGIWFTGQWSKCNTTCGSGNKKRDVICIKTLPGRLHAVVSDDNCDAHTKPLDLDQCQGPVCGSQWYMTSWTPCSQSCGTGYRTREVKCLDAAQQPSDTCQLNSRPKTREPCKTQQCTQVTASSETINNIVNENPDCEDQSQQCVFVQRARLCHSPHYQKVCCKTCAAAAAADS